MKDFLPGATFFVRSFSSKSTVPKPSNPFEPAYCLEQVISKENHLGHKRSSEEGKSFMSSNLSAVLAMAGTRVILVDADLRRPVYSLFEITDEFGLADVLVQNFKASFNPLTLRSDVIAAGPIPPNPWALGI